MLINTLLVCFFKDVSHVLHSFWRSIALTKQNRQLNDLFPPQRNLYFLSEHVVEQSLHNKFIIQQQYTCGTVCRSPMECREDGQPHKTPHLHPRHQHPPPGMTLPRSAWVWLNRLRTGVKTFPLLLVQMGYGVLCGL